MDKNKNQRWHEIALKLPKEKSDWISHLLIELGSIGNLEEETPDPAILGMKGYFPTELGQSSAIIQSIIELMEEEGTKPLSIYSTTLKIQNWAESAQQLFSPIKILKDMTIINPWDEYVSKTGEKTVVINPGMAFGTGIHPTTQLAACLLDDILKKAEISRMCDVGSGSGILSIIASKKGVRKIDAVEIDEDARKSAAGNIKNNNAGNISLLKSIDEAERNYDLIVANILFGVISGLRNDFLNRLSEKSHLVLSGITQEEDEELQNIYNHPNLKLIKTEKKEGWMGYLYATVHDK